MNNDTTAVTPEDPDRRIILERRDRFTVGQLIMLRESNCSYSMALKNVFPTSVADVLENIAKEDPILAGKAASLAVWDLFCDTKNDENEPGMVRIRNLCNSLPRVYKEPNRLHLIRALEKIGYTRKNAIKRSAPTDVWRSRKKGKIAEKKDENEKELTNHSAGRENENRARGE